MYNSFNNTLQIFTQKIEKIENVECSNQKLKADFATLNPTDFLNKNENEVK